MSRWLEIIEGLKILLADDNLAEARAKLLKGPKERNCGALSPSPFH